MVVVMILFGIPPYSVPGVLIHNDVLILGRTAGELTSHNIDCTKLSDNALLITGKLRLGLLFEEQLIGGIVNNLFDILNAILRQINTCHCRTSFLRQINECDIQTADYYRLARLTACIISN